MSAIRERTVSRTFVKREFSIIGLLLIIYSLIVLFTPKAILEYMIATGSVILDNSYLYYGIYFIIVIIGTIVPFFVIRINSKLKAKKIFRGANVKISELLVSSLVFFTVSTALVFATNIVASYFGISGSLVTSIGFMLDDADFFNPIYAFMFVLGSPLIEEYAFRGVLLNSLGKYGKRFALYASAIIYALAHGSFLDMVPSFVMGLLLGKTTLRYKSFQPSLLIHILFNGLIYVSFIIPDIASTYLIYVLAAIYLITIVLVLMRKYNRTVVLGSDNSREAIKLFYTNIPVIIAMAMMVIASLMMVIPI